MQQKILNYNLLFKKEPEGGYTVTVPALQGCVTYGKTLEEAKKMAAGAIQAYIGSLQKHGETVPSDETVFITTVTLPLRNSGKKMYV